MDAFITTEQELEEVKYLLTNSEYVAFDFETTDLHHKRMNILCCSFMSDKLENPVCVPFKDFPNYPIEYTKFDLSAFMKTVFSTDALFIAHNIQFEAKILKYFWGIILQNKLCTLIQSWYLDENRPKGLKYLAPKILGLDMKHFKEVKVDNLPELAEYCNMDAFSCYKLSELFAEGIKKEGLEDLYYDIEMPFIDVLVDMTLTGIPIKVEYLQGMANALTDKLAKLEAEIYKKFGHFNINSAPQLSEKLYGIKYSRKKIDGRMQVVFEQVDGDFADIPAMTKPKKHKNVNGEWIISQPVPSTDDRALKKLNTPIANAIIEYRETAKLLNTYALGYLKWVIDGRIYPNFSHVGTVTGRLASSDPNCQNIPNHPTDGWFMRDAFYAPEGYKLIVADESQIELRVLAHYCKDPTMISAFYSGEDIHRTIASLFLNKTINKISTEERSFAKTLNFGIIYGLGPEKLADSLSISKRKANNLISQYYSTFPYINKLKAVLINQMRTKGYITTILGRKRRIPEINSDNDADRARAERQTVNSKIQGTAGDILKVAMLRIYEDFMQKNLDAHIVLQIHDELVIVVREDHAEQAAKIVKQWMEHPLKKDLRVPLITNPVICTTWSEGKD